MLMAHRIALDPNNVQATHLSRVAGVARFAYNWALAEWRHQYEACTLDSALPKPSQHSLRRQLNAIKREQFPWMAKSPRTRLKWRSSSWGRRFRTSSQVVPSIRSSVKRARMTDSR
nr:helix-turn-helix domain-containing protein [Xylella fastidiosa]